MQRARLARTSLLFLLFAGCAAKRPDVESGTSDSTPASPSSHDVGAESDDDTSADAEAPSAICTPGTGRECTLTYYDVDGRKHCPVSTQYCRADGLGWLACGEPPEPLPDADPDDADVDPSESTDGPPGEP